MSKSDALRIPDYLNHILEVIHRIEKYTKDITDISFLSNSLVHDAVVRNFEIIGGAARKGFLTALHLGPRFVVIPAKAGTHSVSGERPL